MEEKRQYDFSKIQLCNFLKNLPDLVFVFREFKRETNSAAFSVLHQMTMKPPFPSMQHKNYPFSKFNILSQS